MLRKIAERANRQLRACARWGQKAN